MDSFNFQAMAIELNNKIANSRLDKVIQSSAGTLVLKLWTGREKVQLLLKAEGKGAYYLTRGNYTAPAKPPRICQLLRARLRRLDEVRAEPLDRVVHFLFSGRDNSKYDLVFEAIGTQGNLILVDDQGCIVDLLYRRDDNRTLLPGEPYVLPAQPERISLFTDIDKAVNALQDADSSCDSKLFALSPMSPILAAAIRNAKGSGQSYEAILTRLKDSFKVGRFVAQKVSLDGQDGLLPVSILNESHAVEMFEDLSSMVESSIKEDEQGATRDLATRMQAIISKQIRFLIKRKEKIAAERERQSNPEEYKVLGELLLANLHQVKRGDKAIEVENYYQSPPVKTIIKLDAKVSSQENAERYFKLYRKAQRSGEHHARRLQETDEELQWLEQVELSLQEASTGEDLYQVQLELEGAGLLKETKGQLGKRKPPRPVDQLYTTESPAGWSLYWGKNSRTNDYISKTMTAANDYWFHARGMPGSHLVLKCGEAAGKVAEGDILYAAAIAAGYSKAKNDSKVEVIVAKGKSVRKPKGAKPGLVTVDSFRSVVVSPLRLKS